MRRIDFTLKLCEGCGMTMARRRYGKKRRLEKPHQYRKRRTHGKRCDRKRRDRDLAAEHAAAIAAKARPEPHGRGWRVVDCSRCGMPTNVRGTGTRCWYCKKVGGSKRVTFLRKPREKKSAPATPCESAD